MRISLTRVSLYYSCLAPAERIAEQKFAVRTLVTLYSHSSDIPGRSDTLGARHLGKGSSVDPMRLLKKLGQGVRLATTTTATVFGNVASEIAGRCVRAISTAPICLYGAKG